MINRIQNHSFSKDFIDSFVNHQYQEIIQRIFFSSIPALMCIEQIKKKIYPIVLSFCLISSSLKLNKKLKKGESFFDSSDSMIKTTLKVISYVAKIGGYEAICGAVNAVQVFRSVTELKKEIQKNHSAKILESFLKLTIYVLSFSLIFYSNHQMNFMIYFSKLMIDVVKCYFFINKENYIELLFILFHSILISSNQINKSHVKQF